MQTEYKRTREEETFYRLLDEKQSPLSEDVLKLVGLAQHESYKYNLVSNYAYQPVEYFMGMEDMVRLAGELGDQEREFIAAAGRAATVAIDPEDERPAGYKVRGGDVHYYYKMVSGMIEKALGPKTHREREEARVGLWMDYADYERRIARDSVKVQEQAPGQETLDLDDIPF